MAIRLGTPAVVVAALVFAAATIAMFAAEELDALLVPAAIVVAAVITALLFALISLGHASRRDAWLAALVGGLLLATPVPWDWGPHGDDSGYVALWETPRLVAVTDATPLVPYVSDVLD